MQQTQKAFTSCKIHEHKAVLNLAIAVEGNWFDKKEPLIEGLLYLKSDKHAMTKGLHITNKNKYFNHSDFTVIFNSPEHCL